MKNGKPMDLVLNLKGEYFDQIKAGTKQFEYRLQSPYWNKRLLVDHQDGRHIEWAAYRTFRNIIIRKGYPKAGTRGREIIRPWNGAVRMNITHEHFGKYPVAVHAIRVNP